MRTWLLLAVLVVPSVTLAEEPAIKLYAGGNAIWYDGVYDLPSDFELGGSGRASLSPHISLVSGVYYGIDHSYLRGAAGLRMTATDVNDPDFSVGFGIARHASTEPAIRPEEWATDATVGWRPWPVTMPKVVVGAQGSYGLTSRQASLLAGLRYEFAAF